MRAGQGQRTAADQSGIRVHRAHRDQAALRPEAGRGQGQGARGRHPPQGRGDGPRPRPPRWPRRPPRATSPLPPRRPASTSRPRTSSARGTALPDVGVNGAVDDAVFALKAGQTTAPIATDNAVVVAHVKERQDIKPETFATERDALRDELSQAAPPGLLRRLHGQGEGEDEDRTEPGDDQDDSRNVDTET